MKNQILLLLTLGCAFFIQAQDFQGVATYQSKTSVAVNLDGREIPEAQKERIKERMKNAMNRTYELSFDRTTSIYLEQEKLETPTAGNGGGGRGGFRAAFNGSGGDLYKNIQDRSYANQTELFGKIFLIKDSLTNWNWKLGSETKKIGNYTAYKATSVHQVDSTMFERFSRLRPGPRGERREADAKESKRDTTRADSTATNSLLSRIEAPKESIITAWYAAEIPISQGPGNYWGLPGLILEINDGQTAILCTKIVLNPEEKVKIKEPSKGKVVNQEEYDKIMTEKMKEMSERFRGGNRPGGGNGNRPRG